MTMENSIRQSLQPIGIMLCYSIAIAAIFALNGLMVIDASKNFDGLAAIWSANAILLCAIQGQRANITIAGYIAAFAASLFVNWYAGFSALVSLCFSIANIFEVALALYLLEKVIGPETDPFNAKNLHRFVAIMLLTTAASASLAVMALSDSYLKAWQSWFLSDILGMLFVVPSLMILRRNIRNYTKSRNDRRQLKEFLCVSGLTALVTAVVFSQNITPILFLISIPLLIAVFRYGRTGAVFSMLLVAGIAVTSTLNGAGPIAGSDVTPFNQLWLLQLFLASQLLITLPIASVLEGRARDARESVEREQHLRLLAERAQWQAQRSNRIRAIAIARDELTGLLSRSWIMSRLGSKLDRAQNSGSKFTIAIFDIDHFKMINDKYGHPIGDEVLANVGRKVRKAMPHRFSIGRIGGEEFLMLMPDTDLAEAAGYIEHLLKMISLGDFSTKDVAVTISAGIATACHNATTKSLLADADIAMYRAKTAGRNQAKIAA